MKQIRGWIVFLLLFLSFIFLSDVAKSIEIVFTSFKEPVSLEMEKTLINPEIS